ncbi:hypothetical protein [Demequina sp. NBRC 110052]|uniref:hypothetical protein n=1 Tax=Demequina sp. NBRC 110052 TaxID=1570341 RepID=UPI000A0391A3|nr:hypothetical protein [Demequina sp. NBRC 110052]
MSDIEETRPLCAAHPYGYHARSRIEPGPSRHVFRHRSLIGLPARCPMLEEELSDADREVEFADELAVLERTPGPARALLVVVAVAIATLGLVFISEPWVFVLVAIVAALVLERTAAAVRHERIRRIVDWRRRVGR